MLYRSRQRGYLELDLLLGKWATANVATMDNEMLQGLVVLLDEVRVCLPYGVHGASSRT